MTKEELDILKEKIVEEVNCAVGCREDGINTIVELDADDEDAPYAVVNVGITYDGVYDKDTDYFDTTSIRCSIYELSLYENNTKIETPKDFFNEVERYIA